MFIGFVSLVFEQVFDLLAVALAGAAEETAGVARERLTEGCKSFGGPRCRRGRGRDGVICCRSSFVLVREFDVAFGVSFALVSPVRRVDA